MTALTYVVAWRSLASRIGGLRSAAEIHAAFLQGNARSAYGADKYLQTQCEDIRAELLVFLEAFRTNLPPSAISAIGKFMADGGQQIVANGAGDALMVRTIVVKLVALESEISYRLDSPTERIRHATELAFAHLQRLIVVDSRTQTVWKKAYSAGETTCEKIGAVHLLWHGIWAFKVHAGGGRTDLVYQEPFSSTVLGGVGLVLTEWKLDRGSVEEAYREARSQAKQYSAGILAGVELATHRYLVVVTQRQVTPPADVVEAGVTYRHINIAVAPYRPSEASKKKTIVA